MWIAMSAGNHKSHRLHKVDDMLDFQNQVALIWDRIVWILRHVEIFAWCKIIDNRKQKIRNHAV